MGNACAEVVAQDQGPAGMQELSREAARGVLSDPVAQVAAQTATNRPAGRSEQCPRPRSQSLLFLNKYSVHFLCNTAQPKNTSLLPSKKRCI